MMKGPRSGREGGPRSGPEKLSSAPRSTSSIGVVQIFEVLKNFREKCAQEKSFFLGTSWGVGCGCGVPKKICDQCSQRIAMTKNFQVTSQYSNIRLLLKITSNSHYRRRLFPPLPNREGGS